MSQENKKSKMLDLLKLAREILEAHFNNKKPEIPDSIKQKYSEKQACFVTLTQKGELRGCIGSLYPNKPLYKDVIDNTLNAALNDPRFPELTKNELNKTKIEISILSIPKKIEYKNPQDLINKIKDKGVIIKKGFSQATFLPQVWEEVPAPESFLSHLCRKAFLPPDAWKTDNMEVYTYEVEAVNE